MTEEVAKNLVGRPREHDREKIFADLIEWAKKPDSLNLNAFCCSYEPPFSVRKLSEWSKEEPLFRESVETAKAFLAVRREQSVNDGRLHQKAFDLLLPVYDLSQRDYSKEIADEEMERKKKLQESAPQYSHNDMIQLDAFKKAINNYNENKSKKD